MTDNLVKSAWQATGNFVYISFYTIVSVKVPPKYLEILLKNAHIYYA